MRDNIWNRNYYYGMEYSDFARSIEDIALFYTSYLNYKPSYVETEIWYSSSGPSIHLHVDDYSFKFSVSSRDIKHRNISPIKKNIKKCCDEIKKQRFILALAGIK